MIASAKEIDALNITLFSCINSTNVHLCNYCTKIFVIVVNTCVCRRSVDNKAVILSYPVHLLSLLRLLPWLRLLPYVCSPLTTLPTFAKFSCDTCYRRLVHLLPLLRLLRLPRSTCCACYSTFAILLTLAYHVCLQHFLTLPCRLLVQCFLKLLRLLHSTDGIKRQSFHKLSTLSLHLFLYFI